MRPPLERIDVSTEELGALLKQAGLERGEQKPPPARNRAAGGHGRNGAAAYGGACKVPVPHAFLKAGDACPGGCGGKVYAQRDPGLLVRIRGQAPGPEGTPTQCEIVAETAVLLQPAFEELIRQAAQGEVVHNNDTSMRVLSLDRAEGSPERTGVFTSGMVWIVQQRRIALFFTGARHAGENLAEVLQQRPRELPPPIQMCDALSRNVPKLPEPGPEGAPTVLANCNAHGQRNFVKVIANFPDQCRFVLETLGEVYGYDAVARERGLSAEERLGFHQQHSGPVMEKLRAWGRPSPTCSSTGSH